MLLTRTGDYKITVSWMPTWTSEISPVTGYTIERKMGDDDYVFVGTTDSNVTSFEDTVTLDDINYKYRVRTDIQGGSSDWQESSLLFLTAPTQYATGIIDIIDNEALEGTIITAGGQRFIQNFDWFKGVDTPQTARNIAEAISTKSAFLSAAYNPSTGLVDLRALRPGADGNNLGLSATGYGSVASYNLGYPAFGASEPDVVAQWTFEETSGNPVDRVNGYQLIAGWTTGPYNQPATGKWRGVSPGMGLSKPNPYWGPGLYLLEWLGTPTSVINALNPVYSPYTIELVCSVGNHPDTTATLFSVKNEMGGYGSSFTCNWYGNQFRIGQYVLYGSDVNTFTPVHATRSDGKIHHYRFDFVYGSPCKFYIDGYLEWTTTFGLVYPWTWDPGLQFRGWYFFEGGSIGWPGRIYEIRLTKGNRTNNSLNNNTFGPGIVFNGPSLTGGNI